MINYFESFCDDYMMNLFHGGEEYDTSVLWKTWAV